MEIFEFLTKGSGHNIQIAGSAEMKSEVFFALVNSKNTQDWPWDRNYDSKGKVNKTFDIIYLKLSI